MVMANMLKFSLSLSFSFISTYFLMRCAGAAIVNLSTTAAYSSFEVFIYYLFNYFKLHILCHYVLIS
jgi:hypothetical protein